MNYLLHYNVSFSLMQFSSSKLNRKAWEGSHSIVVVGAGGRQRTYWKQDVEWEREVRSTGQRRPAAQEACAEDPGCAHGKLNSELLLDRKSRAAGSLPRAAGAKAQERLCLADPSEGGPQVCRLGIRFQP